MSYVGKLNQDQINTIKEIHKTKGLRLTTASGLSGEMTNSHELIISLLGMAEDNLEQTNKILEMKKVLKRIDEDCQDPKSPNAMNHKIWIEELGL